VYNQTVYIFFYTLFYVTVVRTTSKSMGNGKISLNRP